MTAGVVIVALTVDELERLVARAVTRALEAQREADGRINHFTVLEASKVLRCTDRNVRRLIATGRLRAVKLSEGTGKVLVERASVDALLEGRRGDGA